MQSVVITGASTGIGWATSKLLLDRGFRVFGSVRKQADAERLASEFGAKTSAGWGKLENIFEERVARALEHLGVPSADEVAALRARVEALEAQLKARQAPAPRKTASRTAPAAEAPKRPRRRSER